MNVFSTQAARPEGAPPDPVKHVKFTYGMVLGVDEFAQEFGYLSSRDQWMARDLIGYGTVSGLSLTIDVDAKGGPRIVVSPGVAVTPRGELVRVALAQCASLNEWLSTSEQVKHLQQRPAPLSPPTDRVDVYVTLCYRECATDKVPIPGEPCRREDDTMAPSRVMDDFRLELRWDPPAQPDEAAIRDFVDWLARIPIVDGPSSVTLEAFVGEIRKAAFLIGSPPASPPDFMYGTPPAILRIARNDVCRYLRAAYRVWVTELRPKWDASWWGAQARCCDGRPSTPPTTPEECLLLARLDVPLVRKSIALGSGWEVSSSVGVRIDEEARPFLVPLRMLQEWLWCGASGAGSGSSGSSVVAAGSVVVGAVASGPYQLQASTTGKTGEVRVTFTAAARPPGFDDVVMATPKPSGGVIHPRIEFSRFEAGGFVLIVKDNTTAALVDSLANFELMVQVTRYAK